MHDRLCRLAVGYQDAAAEHAIVALRRRRARGCPELREPLIDDAVAVTRATRVHPDVRQGSSVRGAIDLPWWPGCCSAARLASRMRRATASCCWTP